MSSYYEKPKYIPSSQTTAPSTVKTPLTTIKKLEISSTQYQNLHNFPLTDAKQHPIINPVNLNLSQPGQNYRSITPQKRLINQRGSRSRTPVQRNSAGRKVTPQRSIPKSTVILPPKARTMQQPAFIASPLQNSNINPSYSPAVGEYHFVAQTQPNKENINVVSPGRKMNVEKSKVEIVDGGNWEEKGVRNNTPTPEIQRGGWRQTSNSVNRRPIGGWQTLEKKKNISKTPVTKGPVNINLNRHSTVSPFKDQNRNPTPVKRSITPVQSVKKFDGRTPVKIKKMQVSSPIIKTRDSPKRDENQRNPSPVFNNQNIFSTVKSSNSLLNNTETKSSIYSKFQETGSKHQPQIKENIKIMAENIIQASDSLIEVHKCLNDPRYKQIADNKKRELDDWNSKVKEANLEYRNKIAGLLDNLKYQVASEIGAEELFYELDVIASRLKNQPGDSFRRRNNKKIDNVADHMNDLSKIVDGKKQQDFASARQKIIKNTQLLNRSNVKSPYNSQQKLNLTGVHEETARSTYTIKRSPDRDVNFSQIKNQAIGRKIDFGHKIIGNRTTIKNSELRSKSPLKTKIENQIIIEKNKAVKSPSPDKVRKGVAKPISEFSPKDLQNSKKILIQNSLRELHTPKTEQKMKEGDLSGTQGLRKVKTSVKEMKITRSITPVGNYEKAKEDENSSMFKISNTTLFEQSLLTSHFELKKKSHVEPYVTEKLELDIYDKYTFFENFLLREFNIGDKNANKLTLGKFKDVVYTSGLKGTKMYRIGKRKDEWTKLRDRSDKPSMFFTLSKNNDIINQDPSTNDIYSLNQDFEEVARIYGFTTPLPIYKNNFDNLFEGGFNFDFRNFKHSLDEEIFLWNKGPGCISLVHREKLEEICTIEDFWIYKKQICKPICAVSTRSGNKILGFSELKNFHYIIHYHEKSVYNVIQHSKRIHLLFPRFYCVNSLEINSEGTIVFISGLSNNSYNSSKGPSPGFPAIAACKFNEKLEIINWKILSDSQSFGLPTRTKRVKGTDILLIGCKKHIIVTEFFKEKFEIIEIMKDIHKNQICDFEFDKKTIYSKALDESKVKIIELGVQNFKSLELEPVKKEIPVHTKIFYHLEKMEHINVEGAGRLEKVVITENGKILYTGGQGFNILRYEDKKFKPFHIDHEKKDKFFALRATTSSHAIIQECDTNNFIVYDKYARELRKIEGTHQNDYSEGSLSIWFCGDNSIKIVNLNDLSIIHSAKIFPQFEETSVVIPTRCVSRDSCQLIICVFMIDGIYNICNYVRDEEPDYHHVQDILPNFDKIYCLETSLNNSSVFFAGSTTKHKFKSSKTAGIITACEFNKEMEIKGELIFDGERIQAITCMSRLKGRDELVVGGFKDIFICKFYEKSFEIIGKFKDCHTGFLCDVCCYKNSLFSVCSRDEFIVRTDFEEGEVNRIVER